MPAADHDAEPRRRRDLVRPRRLGRHAAAAPPDAIAELAAGPPGAGLEGTVLARRYRVGRPLGHGASGQVYEALDTRLDRTVALKVFSLAGASPERIADHAAEARVLATLSHPSLVALLDVGADTGPRGEPLAFLSTELVAGQTLHDRIQVEPLGGELTADIGRQVADGMAHAHALGVVHRDIKPSNILVAGQTRTSGDDAEVMVPVVLADFGIALGGRPGRTRGRRAAPGASTQGTASYLSPEQALGRDTGPPTDVYALGLVLLECLTGRRAFPGDALTSSLARLLERPQIPNTIGADWAELLRAMTASDPAERPDAASVAAELSRLRRLEHAASA